MLQINDIYINDWRTRIIWWMRSVQGNPFRQLPQEATMTDGLWIMIIYVRFAKTFTSLISYKDIHFEKFWKIIWATTRLFNRNITCLLFYDKIWCTLYMLLWVLHQQMNGMLGYFSQIELLSWLAPNSEIIYPWMHTDESTISE